MRLRRLDLTRYGKFTDYAIDFGPAQPGKPDLHIVYGLNEAGKSTALSAYLDLLFGVEHTSRYGFLHAYPNMLVGGALEFGGAEHVLRRVKGKSLTLRDGRGQPVDEALLSVPLAGLTRDTYRSMFSLDDQSLEDGGNAIIASKGELGELLFAASAGLADLGSILSKVREEADDIHKLRGRTTQIAELKRNLAALRTQQDEIDTRASAHAVLLATKLQAETSYARAMHEQGQAKTRHDEIERLLRAAPLAGEYQRLQREIEQFGTLPVPPAEWTGQLPGLMVKNAELQTQVEGTQADLARLDGEIAALVIDERFWAQGAAIAGLGDGMARFSTAESDLPRRQAAIAEDEAIIASILAELGQPGHKAPENLILPAPLVGTLRELIEMRSGIDARADTARRELQQAQDTLERVTADLAGMGGADGSTGAALEGINAALGALRRGNHQARMQVAERALPGVERGYHALRDGLAPWSGDGDALRALRLPEQRQLDAWRTRANALDGHLGELETRHRDLVTSQRADEARLEAIRATAGAIDDGEASRLRAARDAAWAVHAKALDATTAASFTAALAEDDALSATRLAHVQDLAELRSLRQNLVVTEAALTRQDELLAQAKADFLTLASEIRTSLVDDICLDPKASVSAWLDQVETWSRQRRESLLAWDALMETEGDLATAKQDLHGELAALAEAMTLAGFENVDDLSPTALVQAADSALTNGGAQRATRSAAEKNLHERQSDLVIRERTLAATDAEAKEWQQRWMAALGKTWFTDSGVGAVRELLRALGELPAALGQRQARARQIETMQRDQQQLGQDVGAILDQLGETLDPQTLLETARALTRRAELAEQDRRLRIQKLAERSRLADILRGLTQDLAVHAAHRQGMTEFFGVETLQQVSAELARSDERTRLRQQADGLGRQLVAELRVDTIEAALGKINTLDLAATEQEGAETAARLDDLEALSRQGFADVSRAREKLQAIGGDDAVARIEAQRRTLLLQIEDKAMDYLRLRTGALVAEQALRAYREQHRSSMMNRASEAFALITRGNYAGLAARPDKDRESLIGLPRQGGSKLATDMSKGTQFQLYLALRLAGYGEFARSRPPVPFIADDIMETFDEPRSAQVFRLLGEMAHTGQVIYLTHHRHLCDIAKEVMPTVKIYELGD